MAGDDTLLPSDVIDACGRCGRLHAHLPDKALARVRRYVTRLHTTRMLRYRLACAAARRHSLAALHTTNEAVFTEAPQGAAGCAAELPSNETPLPVHPYSDSAGVISSAACSAPASPVKRRKSLVFEEARPCAVNSERRYSAPTTRLCVCSSHLLAADGNAVQKCAVSSPENALHLHPTSEMVCANANNSLSSSHPPEEMETRHAQANLQDNTDVNSSYVYSEPNTLATHENHSIPACSSQPCTPPLPGDYKHIAGRPNQLQGSHFHMCADAHCTAPAPAHDATIPLDDTSEPHNRSSLIFFSDADTSQSHGSSGLIKRRRPTLDESLCEPADTRSGTEDKMAASWPAVTIKEPQSVPNEVPIITPWHTCNPQAAPQKRKCRVPLRRIRSAQPYRTAVLLNKITAPAVRQTPLMSYL